MGSFPETYNDPVSLANLLLLLSFYSMCNIRLWLFLPFFPKVFEEQCTQNHPQDLSGLSRALFPTIFLEIAVYCRSLRPRAVLALRENNYI